MDVNIVNEAVRIPYRANVNTDIVSGALNQHMYVLDGSDFPGEDYIFVAEAVSYNVEVTAGQKVRVAVRFPSGGGMWPAEFWFPQSDPWNQAGEDHFFGTLSFRSYLAYGELPADGIKMSVYLDTAVSGTGDFSAYISGYFVPLDSPSISP
jgi:hypothetical protein